MRTPLAAIVVSLLVAGAAEGAVATFDFADAHGVGYRLSADGELSFDNLYVTASSNADDLLDYVIEIGNLKVDAGSRTVLAPGISLYGFSVGTADFRVFNPNNLDGLGQPTEYLTGTLTVDGLISINGFAVAIDSDTDGDDLVVTANTSPAQTLIDLAAVGHAGFTMTLTSLADFDGLLQGGGSGTGPMSGVVPEPATVLLVGLSLGGLFLRRRRAGEHG